MKFNLAALILLVGVAGSYARRHGPCERGDDACMEAERQCRDPQPTEEECSQFLSDYNTCLQEVGEEPLPEEPTDEERRGGRPDRGHHGGRGGPRGGCAGRIFHSLRELGESNPELHCCVGKTSFVNVLNENNEYNRQQIEADIEDKFGSDQTVREAYLNAIDSCMESNPVSNCEGVRGFKPCLMNACIAEVQAQN